MQEIARADESPLQIPYTEEQTQRSLRRAESAERLQRQDQPRIPRDCLVATDEEHSQQLVTNLAIRSRGRRLIGRSGEFSGGSLEDLQPSGIFPQGAKQGVACDAVQPGVGVLG